MEGDGLKVIGAGLMRTGTMSLKSALERLLDGRCYHMTTVFQNPQDVKFWMRMLRDEASDEEIRKFFRGYRAATAFPTVVFYQRIVKVFPDAKVILSLRDHHSWYQSVQNTLVQMLTLTGSFPLNYISVPFSKFANMKSVRPLLLGLLERFFGPNFDLSDRERMIQRFDQHTDEVKSVIDPDRLLVFQATDGWQPLCDHLGLPVPDQPYPNTNSSAERQSGFNNIRMIRKIAWAIIIAAGAVMVYAGKKVYERM